MVSTSEPKRKGRPPRKVQHPVFITLSEFTLDDYWKQILLSCSLGKFPRYVSYKDDLLTHRRGRASTSIPLLIINTQAVDFKRVIDFFRSIGLCSLLDNELNQKRVNDKQKALQVQKYETWKDIKRQGIKDIILQTYINELHESLNLTMKEYRFLQATISIAMLFKYINTTTVVMKDNKIIDLIGLKIEGDERGKRKFSFPYSLCDNTSSSPSPLVREDVEPPDQSKSLAVAWTKYLEDLRRKHEFYQALPKY
jgi:hypothetical protein